MNQLYSKRSGLFIGFHGCPSDIRDELLLFPQNVKKSTNSYDWLGTGFYVWENNLDRALDWAKKNPKKGKGDPSVIGVVYELGNCLDLMDSGCIDILKKSYAELKQIVSVAGLKLPVNQNHAHDMSNDKIIRNLDCAIINQATHLADEEYLNDIGIKGFSNILPYDTVRGCFTEGKKIFDTEIYEKTHIQVCIRNLNCIKGFFKPREYIKFPKENTGGNQLSPRHPELDSGS